MTIRHQPKLKVIVIALIFSGLATIQPGLRYQVLAEDHQPEVEGVREEPQPPVDEPAPSEESGEPSGTKISDETKGILLACLLLCNPLGLVIAAGAAQGGAGEAALFIMALPIVAAVMLIGDMYGGEENKEDAYTLKTATPVDLPDESQELNDTLNE